MIKTINLICPVCSKEFIRLFAAYKYNTKFNRSCCCSRKCSAKFKHNNSKPILCKNCNKEFYRKPSHIKRVKNNFCCKSCSSSYNVKHKKFGTRRSKLEIHIENFIKDNFPNLEFKCNSKEEIGSELDFYFPSLKLAIEINGIYHYEPIHGSDKLTKIQNNDKAKLRACDEKGIDLIIISDNSSRTLKEREEFNKIILLIINNRIK